MTDYFSKYQKYKKKYLQLCGGAEENAEAGKYIVATIVKKTLQNNFEDGSELVVQTVMFSMYLEGVVNWNDELQIYDALLIALIGDGKIDKKEKDDVILKILKDNDDEYHFDDPKPLNPVERTKIEIAIKILN